jgi:F-type H+-transporting ATPase subunit gamma
MATQKEVKNRIASVKNIGKITRAMEMVAAARLRRAEQRITALRPYARAIRRMTRQAAEAAGGSMSRVPVLMQHDETKRVAVLLVTGDRGLAGSFNSQILRTGTQIRRELAGESIESVFYAVGRRGDSSLRFRGEEVGKTYMGFTDRPGFANAREIAHDLIAAYTDEEVDRVEIVYNRYVSPLTQIVTKERLLPLQEADIIEGSDKGEQADEESAEDDGITAAHKKALWLYEPEPEEILASLVPDYVDLSVYRALLESAASEHGARMTAMRNASENAQDMIGTLTLEMNRVRQAEITQEILEVVSGAEALG